MPRARDTWRFEWRRTWAEVWDGPFERTWRRMFDASDHAHVYQHPALVRAWADTCGSSARVEPMMGLATSHGGDDVVLPWIVTGQRGSVASRRRLESAGEDLFGYHDPLIAAPPGAIDWASFWREVRSSSSTSCDQALFRFVHAEFAPDAAPRTSDDSPILALDRRGGFPALLADCSANHRGDVRRRLRRLAERGDAALWMAGPADADEALAEWRSSARAAYGDVWNRRRKRNSVYRDGFDAFAERVVSDGVRDGWGHFAALKVDGQAIAWHLGLADRGRLHWWIPIHRSEWEAFSPGKVLLALLVERLCGDGWRELHFMTGGQPYKLAWRPALADLRVLRWHARGLRGAVFALYDTVRGTTR
jgi:CelD/BcsL family acetyltransferase involved in cellulose biosynthesis